MKVLLVGEERDDERFSTEEVTPYPAGDPNDSEWEIADAGVDEPVDIWGLRLLLDEIERRIDG